MESIRHANECAHLRVAFDKRANVYVDRQSSSRMATIKKYTALTLNVVELVPNTAFGASGGSR